MMFCHTTSTSQLRLLATFGQTVGDSDKSIVIQPPICSAVIMHSVASLILQKLDPRTQHWTTNLIVLGARGANDHCIISDKTTDTVMSSERLLRRRRTTTAPVNGQFSVTHVRVTKHLSSVTHSFIT